MGQVSNLSSVLLDVFVSHHFDLFMMASFGHKWTMGVGEEDFYFGFIHKVSMEEYCVGSR